MEKNSQTIVFTDDASRGNPGPGGWGAIVVQNGEVKELGGREDHTTNNRMELTAALKVLEVVSNVTSQLSIVIHTDSNYLINGITKWIYSWEKRNWITQNKEPVLNKDLWEKLLELTKNKRIEWKYVGGHSGIPGNERVDEIATEFADKKEPELFSGPVSKYKIDVLNLKGEEKKKSSKSKSKAKAYSYLSMVDGVIEKHQTWAECEKRVKGKSGAKYKKVLSAEEEAEVIKNWKNF